ncbi:hypothetical protein [Paraburkholderia sp. J67]|uniref:hypothetical protein n=1 Tax=Paraburkholderia sp. J67 TaxID=2805435 RepID=UPI002ABE4090|nr:hypothetical protein [Paraburkholderia sp. J67]
MPTPHAEHKRGIVPVHPDSLLAAHIERHIHLYIDYGMGMACLFIFCGAYCAEHLLLDRLL